MEPRRFSWPSMGSWPGAIGIADAVKPSTPQALAALREAGLRIVMLTGDNRTTAEAVAKRLGITEVEADVLPERKADVVASGSRTRAASWPWRATG